MKFFEIIFYQMQHPCRLTCIYGIRQITLKLKGAFIMKKFKRITAVLACFIILVLVVSACGSAKSASTSEYDFATEEAAGAVDDYEYGNGYAASMTQAKAYDGEETADTGSGSPTEPEQPEAVEPAESNQKLVYTCWMTIQTLEFDKTQSSVKDAVKKVGGIIESESVTDSDYHWYYDSYYKKSCTLTSNLTVRVPSAKYEEFLTLLDGAGGKVTNKSQNVENITKRYNDQTVYIQSLETQEQRLMEMMEKAETVEEMITVEARLTEVQTELNQARSSLANMDTDVKYSTVNLTLEEVVKYTDTPKTPLTFGERVADAFVESWANFVAMLQGIVIGLIYILPTLLLVLAILLVVFLIHREYRKKHPRVKKEKAQSNQPYDNRGFFRGPANRFEGRPGNQDMNRNTNRTPNENANTPSNPNQNAAPAARPVPNPNQNAAPIARPAPKQNKSDAGIPEKDQDQNKKV
jgi:uncharacterized membrane protein